MSPRTTPTAPGRGAGPSSWRSWTDAWSRSAGLRRALFHGFLAFLALVVLTFAPADIPDAARAARGEGQPGTFSAQVEQCTSRLSRTGEICSWTGRYVSDDGSTVVDDVLLDSDLPDRVGDRVPVLYEGEREPPVVYLPGDHTAVIGTVGMTALAIGYLLWCAWRVVRWHRRGRPALVAPRPPAPAHGRAPAP